MRRYICMLGLLVACGGQDGAPEDPINRPDEGDWMFEDSPCKILDKTYEVDDTVCIENQTHRCGEEGFVVEAGECGEFIDIQIQGVSVRTVTRAGVKALDILGRVESVGTRGAVDVDCTWKLLERGVTRPIHAQDLFNPNIPSIPVASEMRFSDQWDVPDDLRGEYTVSIDCEAANETDAKLVDGNSIERMVTFD